MRRSGCGNEMTQSLCRMKSETKTWRSWTERRRNQRADDADGLVVGSPTLAVSLGIWTGAMGPSTHRAAS